MGVGDEGGEEERNLSAVSENALNTIPAEPNAHSISVAALVDAQAACTHSQPALLASLPVLQHTEQKPE